MAGEITISLSVVGSKGGAVASVTASEILTMTDSDISSQTVTFNATPVVVPLGAVLSGGIMAIKNMDTSNKIAIGSSAVTFANAPIRINVGETILIRSNSATVLYGCADTALTALAQVTCFDN